MFPVSEPFILNPPRYELAAVPVVNPPVIFTFPLSTVKTSVIISGSLPAEAIFLIQIVHLLHHRENQMKV